MKRVLNHDLPKKSSPVSLDPAEAQHLIQVLRARQGDLIEVIDGKGGSVRARLIFRGKAPWLEWDPSNENTVTPTQIDRSRDQSILPIAMEVALLKSEAMEWLVEKAVEIGAATLTPLLTDHTVIQLGRKTPEDFRERLQKIADQALKQCGRRNRLEVGSPVALSERFRDAGKASDSTVLFCDEQSRSDALSLPRQIESLPEATAVHLVIGPEGGWSDRERQQISTLAWKATSLGPMVLRAETAAIYSLSVTAAILRDRMRADDPTS